MEKNDKTGKQSYDELENSAQGLLRRLNNRYDATRVEAEKSAMKNLDAMEDSDAGDPDVVAYTATAEVPAVKEKKKKKNPSQDTGEISEAELQSLFDKYLGGENKSSESAGYDGVHQRILDAEQRSGVDSMPKTDVEKNIDEAEKYIDSISTSEELVRTQEPPIISSTVETIAAGSGTGEYGLTLDSTEQLAAYEPEAAKEKTGKKEKAGKRESSVTAETEIPTDTAMMKAFGLNPQKAETADTGNLFGEFSLADTGDLQSTEEISARELEGEEAEPVSVGESGTGEFEYTDPAQNKSIFAIFKSKYNFARLRMILAGVLAVFLLLLENIPSVAESLGGKNNFVAVDWVLSFACFALVLDRMLLAVKALLKFEFDPDSITLVAFVLSFVTTLVTAFAAPSYEIPRMYNFAFAVCVFLNTVCIFISLRRDVYSFKVVSSGKVKKVIMRTGVSENVRTPEEMEFSEYLGDGADVAVIKKTDFVSDFFARRRERPRSTAALKIFLPVCLGVAVIFFFLAKFAMDQTVAESFGTAYATFLMTAPFAAFFSYAYPIYLASRRAYTYNSAIVGDKTPEEYENTAVVAFRDEDAFPAGKIKVRGIKIFADRNIENVVYYASSVFSKLGGPLSSVFRQATLNSVNSEDVEIREIANEGVCAMVDGKNIVIGRPAYMENQCFETMPEEGDEEYEGQSNKRILYLACEQIIIAKFYIQYNTTSDFVYIVRHLADAGVCVSIRTADPCIDDGILYDNKMNPEKYPVKIIKGLAAEEKSASISAENGGVISVGSVKDTVKTMMLCDKLGNVGKTNLVLKTVASVLGVAVMALVLFTGAMSGMLSLYPALYQCFWLIPMICVSKIYI